MISQKQRRFISSLAFRDAIATVRIRTEYSISQFPFPKSSQNISRLSFNVSISRSETCSYSLCESVDVGSLKFGKHRS